MRKIKANVTISKWEPPHPTKTPYVGIFIDGNLDTAYTPERFGDLERYARFLRTIGYKVPDVNMIDLVKMLEVDS